MKYETVTEVVRKLVMGETDGIEKNQLMAGLEWTERRREGKLKRGRNENGSMWQRWDQIGSADGMQYIFPAGENVVRFELGNVFQRWRAQHERCLFPSALSQIESNQIKSADRFLG